MSGQLHTPAALPQEKSSRTHWIGGWVNLRAGWATWRKFLTLPGLELRPLGRPARSQSLYRLHYPGSSLSRKDIWKMHTGTEEDSCSLQLLFERCFHCHKYLDSYAADERREACRSSCIKWPLSSDFNQNLMKLLLCLIKHHASKVHGDWRYSSTYF
jgi:hypothetical protein